MKSIIAAFLLIITVLSGCSSANKEEYINPVNFYYLQPSITFDNSGNVITSEIRDYGNEDAPLNVVISQYLTGPTNSDLVSPFPENIQLKSFLIDDEKVYITLSNQLTELDNYSQTIACACITKTILGITSAKSVEIRVDVGTIQDGALSITMDADSLLLFDNTPILNDKRNK